MRILQVNKFFRDGAGAETAFFETRRLLKERGHEVVDFAMRGDRDLPSRYARHFAPTRVYDGGSTFNRVRDASASVYSISARRALARLLDEVRPDIAHLHNVYHQLTLSLVDELAARRIPTVMTLHDYKIVCPAYTLFVHGAPCRRCVGGSPLPAIRHRCIKGSLAASALAAVEAALARSRHTYRRLDALIAPSRFMADLAARQVDGSRVHVIPNFLDSPAICPPTVPGSPPFVLFAGRLEEVKGVRVLLDTFRDAPAGVVLKVAGAGPLEDEVREASQAHANIQFLGRLDRPHIRELMRSSLAMVLPALWEENCPMIVLEARAAGTAVVCSERGGLAELVTHGSDGLLFDPAVTGSLYEAVRRLAGDPSLRAKMVKAGQARLLTHHTPDAHYDALNRVYEQVCDRASRALASIEQ